jgi:RNA polymerase sigma-70 factor (ECF subfamily)
MPDHEEALVRSARSGDRAAFEELVRRTTRLVFARLYLDTGDRHRAEDLVQETMLAAFRRLRTLQAAHGFRSWLLRIAQNVAIDAARREGRHKRAAPTHGDPTVLERISGPGPRPDEQAEQREMRGQVLAILRSLPEEYRMPLMLRYVAGSDYETICMELGLSNGSLRGLLHRGLKLLRTKLEQTGGKRE